MAVMIDDALLGEASDPTTSPERLAELMDWSRPTPGAADDRPRRTEVSEAVLSNPAVPLVLLRWHLRAPVPDRNTLAAWHNPAVALLLLSEPLPAYEEAACRLLRWVQGGRTMPSARWGPERGTLASRIAPWAEGREAHVLWEVTPGRLTAEQRDEARRVAARLAALFGLPWPGR